MSNREINESPERTTAGLSSAIQIVDFTGAETYAIGNTSCLSPVIGSLIRGIGLPHEESEHASRKADFKTAMHESLQKNESIIAELAKYQSAMYCKYLTKKQVLKLHEIALKSGGAEGLLAEGMLELALETPHITFFGTEFHSSLSRKAAAIMHEVIKLHPFIDGNKRTGFLAADTFLRVNGYELLAPERNAIDLTLETSRCSIDIAGIARWIETSFRRRRIR